MSPRETDRFEAEGGVVAIDRLTPEDLSVLARDIAAGKVFATNDPDVVRTSFPVVLLADPATLPIAELGAVYEEMSRAAPRAVNGRPMFFSCRLVHVDDVEPLIEAIERWRTTISEVLGDGDDHTD